MGLHFQYKGNLTDAGKLPELVFEVEDICNTLDWPMEFFETQYPKDSFLDDKSARYFGIQFTPLRCEPVYFTFDGQGRLINPFFSNLLKNDGQTDVKVITVQLNLDDENPEPIISENQKDFDFDLVRYMINVQTDMNDSTGYIQVIEFIRYISNKYFENFTLTDDMGYWTNKNPDTLTERLQSSKIILDELHEKISHKSFHGPEEFLQFIKELSILLKKTLKENKD